MEAAANESKSRFVAVASHGTCHLVMIEFFLIFNRDEDAAERYPGMG